MNKILQSDLWCCFFFCQVHSSAHIIKDQKCQMANDFLRMVTTFNLSPVSTFCQSFGCSLQQLYLWCTFNLPAGFHFIFRDFFFLLLSAFFALAVEHHKHKLVCFCRIQIENEETEGCANIEQILKINNNNNVQVTHMNCEPRNGIHFH